MRKAFIAIFLLISIGICKTAFAFDVSYSMDEVFNNHGSIMIFIDSKSGQIIEANNAAAQFYGYSREELRNMTIDKINTLSADEVKAEMALASEQKRNYFIFKHKTKNGDIRDVEVYSYPVMDSAGNAILFSIIHDITPRVTAEKQLEQTRLIVIGLLALLLVAVSITLLYINWSRKKISLSGKRYQNLFDNMQEGFALHEIILDGDGKPADYRFLEVNKAFETITGLKIEAIKGRTVKEVLPGTDDFWIENYGKVALDGNPTTLTNFSKEVGKYFFISVYSPEHRKFATIFTDVSESKQLEEMLRSERSLFKTTLHSLGDGVISTDAQGNTDIMNAAAEQLTGWTMAEARGTPFEKVFNIRDSFTGKAHKNPVTEVFATKDILHTGDYVYLIDRDGKSIPVEYCAAPIKDEDGNINGAVIILRDYSEKKEKLERIEYLSYHDQLTGLYNRHFFEEELERLDIDRNLPISLAMVDVNGLKLTNDAFGHLSGDELLKRVAEILKKECRGDEIVARIGGDEFIILLPLTTDAMTEGISKRIHNSVAENSVNNIVISVSMGWDTKNYSDQSIRDVFIKAEENMYRKKLTETQSMRNQTIQVILKTLNEKNEREKIHSERVSNISKQIGEAMLLDYETLKEIEIAGLMHDIGKISINENLLEKPDSLTDIEFREVQRHTESGYQILKSVDAYSSLSECVLSHHERWDGTGYPRGIKGSDIPLIARIITIADAFEALTANRPYRKGIDRDSALAELKQNSGTQFDPEILLIFEQQVFNNLSE